MKLSKAEKIWLDYHQIHSKKNRVRAHSFVKNKFCHNSAIMTSATYPLTTSWTS
jgi:hypothetical protein